MQPAKKTVNASLCSFCSVCFPALTKFFAKFTPHQFTSYVYQTYLDCVKVWKAQAQILKFVLARLSSNKSQHYHHVPLELN